MFIILLPLERHQLELRAVPHGIVSTFSPLFEKSFSDKFLQLAPAATARAGWQWPRVLEFVFEGVNDDVQ